MIAWLWRKPTALEVIVTKYNEAEILFQEHSASAEYNIAMAAMLKQRMDRLGRDMAEYASSNEPNPANELQKEGAL